MLDTHFSVSTIGATRRMANAFLLIWEIVIEYAFNERGKHRPPNG